MRKESDEFFKFSMQYIKIASSTIDAIFDAARIGGALAWRMTIELDTILADDDGQFKMCWRGAYGLTTVLIAQSRARLERVLHRAALKPALRRSLEPPKAESFCRVGCV